jgi:hypothetical protein
MSDISKYERSGKAYYEAHKAELLEAEKDKKRWLTYYERNKDAVKERNRAAYYKRKGLEVPPRKEPKPKTPREAKPLKSPELARVESLISELRELLPGVVKVKGLALPELLKD